MKLQFSLWIISMLLYSCTSDYQSKEYFLLDLTSTSDSLSLFGENIVSTSLYERDLAISPNQDELIYTIGDYKQNRRCLVTIRKKDGQWEEPKILSISGKYNDIEPFFANKGKRLYFVSNRPIFNDQSRDDYNIWYSDLQNEEWSKPIALDSMINTVGDEFFPSLSDNGNLYFTANKENGFGREDIYISKFVNGEFQNPEALPTSINSSLFEFNAYVNPKEEYIIFSSFGREDGFGGGDLYISEKDENGQWSTSKNLGKDINSDKLDYCPFVDTNSQTLYFTSERFLKNTKKINSINELKTIANMVNNGYGNIYKVPLDKVRIKE